MDEKKKNLLIITLLIAIISMSVGYAALAQVLNINGTANISAVWDVEITNIVLKNSIGAKEKQVPIYDDRSATFNVDLSYPGAFAIYTVYVENKGTVDSELSSISGVEEANLENPNQIKYEVVENSETNILNAGEKTSFDVKVNWESVDKDAIPLVTNKSATINLNYIQK